MKKYLLFIFLVFVPLISINADNIYDFSLQLSNIKTGVYINSGIYNNIGLSAEIFNLYFESKDRKNLSFKLSPLNITERFEIVDKQETNLLGVM
jgi:hypothetical protein